MNNSEERIALLEDECAQLKEKNEQLETRLILLEKDVLRLLESKAIAKEKEDLVQEDNEDISLKEIFCKVSIDNDRSGFKTGLHNALCRMGISSLQAMKSMTTSKMIKLGAARAAFVCIILDHYGYHAELNQNEVNNRKREIELIKERMAEYSERVHFSD